jgi:ATP-binding cassette subfamily C protein CydC
VLTGLSLDLPQGRRIAVIGPTGAGKSTLILLMTGLIRPECGQILVNGRADLDSETLRRHFAVAPQTPGLFTGTLRGNLCLGRPDAPDALLWQTLKLVRLDDFAASLPDGLDSWLGEAGLTLSGGQARRLSIARALLKDAPVVVLDEPGEGLDYQTEKSMLRGVVDALDGRSLLLITHRRAGLDLMDEVVSL